MQWNELKIHIRHIGAKDQKRVQRAFEIGKKAHEGQLRKSGEPYYTHPIAVAHILADMGADADTLIAALLHDTVEDTDLTLKMIDKEFNGDVAALIDGVTKLEPEDVEGVATLDDQIETLRKTFDLIEGDVRVIIIKLADRLHNMQTIEHLAKQRQKEMAQETLDVFVKIADRLSMATVRDELEGLCLAIINPAQQSELVQLQEFNEGKSVRAIRVLRQALVKEHPSAMKHVEMYYEKKSWGKLLVQKNAGERKITGVADMIVTFVCRDIAACYAVLGALHQSHARETLSFQDFINAPMINGYKGLHTTVILEKGTRVRCKIRTEEMQDYAQRGITVFCFDDKAQGVREYLLPWTERIARLSKDTAQDSDDFWESLQHDILGESMVIHGVDDSRVLVPAGATALDGALYCFGKKALKMTAVAIDGIDVAMHTPLPNASSISITAGKKNTVEREWLRWASAGLPTAIIRDALAKQPGSKKHTMGKTLLQEIFTENKKGYIEEFDEQSVRNALHGLGYKTIEDAYIAIADGHLEPSAVFEALFNKPDAQESAKRVPCHISFTLDFEDIDSITGTLDVYKKHGIPLTSVKFHPFAMMRGKIGVHHSLTPKEQHSIQTELTTIGAKNVTVDIARSRFKFLLGAFFLLTIWGFDPAIAHRLIAEFNVSPIDLTLIRFWALAGLSGLLVLWKSLRNELPYARVSIFNRKLWYSVMLMISISLTTYAALRGTEPSHYTIPMTTGGILLTTIVNRKRWALLTCTWSLLLLGIALLVLFTPGWSLESMIYTLLAVTSFSAFSVVSERHKQESLISARAVQYFFTLTILCALLTLPLIQFATLGTLTRTAVMQIALFSVFFAGLPYYMYYYMLTHKQIDFVLRYSFLIILTTMIGQVLFSASPVISPVTMIAGAIVALGAMLPLVLRK